MKGSKKEECGPMLSEHSFLLLWWRGSLSLAELTDAIRKGTAQHRAGPNTPTSFEEMVQRLKLSEEKYRSSMKD
jgi:hypothetical protein